MHTVFIVNLSSKMSEVSPQSFSRPKYRADIDGMRALAILAVLIFHAYPRSLPGGFVGVDIFFVISGYLISGIIFRGLTLESFSFFDFYARRVRRIFPAVTVVLLGSFIFGFCFLTPYQLEELIEESPYAAFFLENWRLFQSTGGYWDIGTELKPLMHFWSLGVEEQYYIFYPLICFILWKANARVFLFSLLGMLFVSLGLCLYDTANAPIRAFYSLHSRFWELLIGGVLAYVEVKWPDYKLKFVTTSRLKLVDNSISWLGLLSIILAICLFEEGKNFPGWRALLPTMGSLLIIMAGTSAFLNRYLFANRLAVFVGLISYPLYLWHWPLICIARNNLGGELPTGSLMLGILGLSVVLSYLTYVLIERPMRSRKATWQLVLTCVLVLSIATLGTKTLIRRSQAVENLLYAGLPVVVQETLKDIPRNEETDHQCEAKFGDGHVICRATSANPSMLVLGDSHNHFMWSAMYYRDDLPDMYVVASGALPILEGLVIINKAKEPDYEKALRTSRAWDVIRESANIQTVILRGYWSSHLSGTLISSKHKDLTGYELIKQHWRDTFEEMNRLNKTLVVVLDNVDATFNPLNRCVKVQRYSLNPKYGQTCMLTYGEINQEQYEMREFLRSEAKKWSNVKIIDAWEALCDQKGCYLVKEGVPYYRDNNHLSVYGNVLVWDLIARQLK